MAAWSQGRDPQHTGQTPMRTPGGSPTPLQARKIRALLRSNLLYNRYLPVTAAGRRSRRGPSA